ncbi:MAG: hypothetical protein HY019_07810 [Aquabacterium sp.]|uniref:hypothetical protein n=1 Tax=Aquabacterium sp. TaxID=1872578 RepID=UPI0025BEAD44|nr:hypothetical protein [Aquabacterium sp.]MBI3381898.1 hypothetical protein [Aquabacterium sp.]
MQTPLIRKRAPLMAWLCGIALSLLVAGCGGGGGGASSSSGGSGAGASTSVVTLSGVAAQGAPLIGATVSVIDANGASQGSTLASLVSGEYQLPLSSPSVKFPLLVQAAGVDMAGNPVVLHTVVLSGTAGQTTMAHITPLTNAVVAMLLGGDPRPRFTTPSSIDSTTWTRLGNSAAVTAANGFLLTVITPNLAGVKPTALNKATLNIFSDPNFHADKTGMDALIDGVQVQLGKDVIGNEVLRLSNSLILAGSSEVVVNLTTAKTGLSLATPAVASNAITSSRITTTNSTTIAHVADLSTLQSRINDLLAVPGVTAGSFNPNNLTRAPIVSASYNYFNGLDWGGLIDQFVAYGTAGYQLSAFQVVGCLDDPVPSGGCAKVRIASLLRSSSTGQIMQVFENVASWSSTAGWTFVGNDSANAVYLYPATWQQWTSHGVVSGGTGLGLQTDLSTVSTLVGNAPRLGLPNPNSSARTIYVPPSGSGPLLLVPTETGDLITDQVLAVTQVGPLSTSDVVPGALYKLTSTALIPFPADPLLGQFVADKVYTTRLTAELPTNLAASAYPMMDNVTTVPLTSTDMTNGLSFSWNTWAAANPQLRMVEVRAVITSTASAPVKQVVTLIPMSSRQLTLTSFAGLVPADAIQFTLWLIAQDEQGRRYISKIVADS